MDNLNLVELMYGIAESGSYAALDLEPGEAKNEIKQLLPELLEVN